MGGWRVNHCLWNGGRVSLFVVNGDLFWGILVDDSAVFFLKVANVLIRRTKPLCRVVPLYSRLSVAYLPQAPLTTQGGSLFTPNRQRNRYPLGGFA